MHNRYLFKELIEEYMEVVKRHRNNEGRLCNFYIRFCPFEWRKILRGFRKEENFLIFGSFGS